ncbi:uncharacterized protein LOC135848185 [Planococcus citri]|uniref:uncharacterized protein LOC135848185 n=1 Tax=Planococcus citri TaxID=170843 RepID=UPI0031F86022
MYKSTKLFILFLFVSPIRFSFQQPSPLGQNHQAEHEEEKNVFLDAAQDMLGSLMEKNPDLSKNAAMGALSGIFQTMKGGQAIGDLLSGMNIPGGSGGGSNVASNILSGIAGMLEKNPQGFDPKILGQVAGVFSSLAESKNEAPGTQSSPDWGSILGLAGNLISSMSDKNSEGGGGGLEGLLNLLPMLTGNVPSGHVHFADNELEDESEHNRYQKESYTPPFMHIFYEYWEHFKQSEFGETVWKKSGLEAIFQLFIDKDGYFQVDRIFESMENASFRRKWIKSLSSFVGEWIRHLSDPSTQARYIANIKYFGNSFLKAQGYSKSVYFDPTKPTDSAISIIDAITKKHFALKINSGKYIKPAVIYLQEVFKIGEGKNLLSMTQLSSKEISDKLADVLNGELIEPVLRVWRAYKFSILNPHCDRQLLCYLNKKDNSSPARIGLKPGVMKLSSLSAAWYLSGRTGTPFWKLYNAVTEDMVCEVHYPGDCHKFYAADHAFTTESNNLHGEEL